VHEHDPQRHQGVDRPLEDPGDERDAELVERLEDLGRSFLRTVTYSCLLQSAFSRFMAVPPKRDLKLVGG
jgi:hypothetical protein